MAQIVDSEVFVIGGGPAGLAAAIALRRQGISVTVADCAAPPIDKACGEGLMPDSLAAVHRLGVRFLEGDGAPFHGIRFAGREGSVAATFPKGHGLGIRRLRLHHLLALHAHRAGARMLWRTRVSLGDQGSVTLDGAPVRSRWIIGADGQHSRVREWAGLSAGRSHARRFALRRHFRVRPWSDLVEIHWSDKSQGYVTPVGADEVCVALISREQFASFEEGVAAFPELGPRLAGTPPATAVRGALSISRRLDRVYRGNVALLGEASGSVDAITGEGLALAFRQALALASALAAGDLSAYAAAHRHIGSLPEFMARSMLLLDASPAIRRRALRALESRPDLFARLLAVHVGELPIKNFGAIGLLNLGWRILAA